MKLREIFRYEFAYQIRRLPSWICFVLLLLVSFQFVRGSFLAEAMYAEFYLNAPFIIAGAMVLGSLFWLVLAAVVVGEVAARDVETGMHPLAYTAPVRIAEYLGGRFLVGFALSALTLLAIPLGVLLAVHLPGVDPEVVGPFRPAAYLTAYGFIALPNAFIGSAVQFACATLGRRAIGAYLGSVLLLFLAYGGILAVLYFLQREDVALFLDLFGHVFMTSDVVLGWTAIEKNTRLIELEGSFLWSRLLWVGFALGALAFTFARFRFEHHTPRPLWKPFAAPRAERAPRPGGREVAELAPLPMPAVARRFGPRTHLRQTLALTRTSFLALARSRGGLPLLALIAAIAVLVLPQNLANMGTPLLPRTDYLLGFLTTGLTDPGTPWLVIPLLIIVYSGELVWREREAGLGEIAEAAPVPDWVQFLGRFLGLSLILAVWMVMIMAVGIIIQLRKGYFDVEPGLYLAVLFGLQLPEYLLFAVLALVIQGIANQKYVGHMLALVVLALLLFAPWLGIQHNLLVYGAAPRWSYTDMRGFGPTVVPWLWFILYWAAWALLLAVVARLLWLRGQEGGLRLRLRQARSRFTPATRRAAVVAGSLVLLLGGFVFYNTNVRNRYRSPAEAAERRAEYERRYGAFADLPQPQLTAVALRMELHPRARRAAIRGSYRLVNRTAVAIDSLHLSMADGMDPQRITLDRAATLALADGSHGYRIYALHQPLLPGDTLLFGFAVEIAPNGFRNGGVDPAISSKSTFFKSDRLPAIGYQASRELLGPSERREHGLPQRPLIPLLADAGATQDITGEGPRDRVGADLVQVDVVLGTTADQIAIGPGLLRRSWVEAGRRYFHYVTDRPIGNEYAFFSAPYAVHREMWTPAEGDAGGGEPVAIELYYHPRHTANVERMLRSARASLEQNTRAFGPFPYSHVRLVENAGSGIGAHADASTINFSEGFSRFDPAADPRGLDLPFAVMAHEMAHPWGVPYAYREGAPLLSESFAWYAAMGVVDATFGREHLRQLLRFFRQPHPIQPIRQSVPLLRAMDPYAAYRKGPFALHAMGEYMGKERVDLAFRRLIEAHRAPEAPRATSLDLYRELQAVTPDSLRPLLHDLFAENTVWELETEQASAHASEGGWRVTLRVRARKVAVDPAGVEQVLPMDEWVPIGVFAPTGQGADFGEELYLRMHRIRSGVHTITVEVSEEPADAGIDPYHLLIDLDRFDNVEEVEIER